MKKIDLSRDTVRLRRQSFFIVFGNLASRHDGNPVTQDIRLLHEVSGEQDGSLLLQVKILCLKIRKKCYRKHFNFSESKMFFLWGGGGVGA